MVSRWERPWAIGKWGFLVVLVAGMSIAPLMAAPAAAAEKSEQARLIDPEDASIMPGFVLENLDGDDVNCDDLLEEGVIFLDFWALWCRPCLKELDFLDEFVDEYGEQGFTVVAINIDTPEARDRVESYIQSKGYGFEVLLDPDKDVYYDLDIPAIPYSVLIDPEGRIRAVHIGFQLGDEETLEEEIEALLGETGTEIEEETTGEETTGEETSGDERE